MYNRGGGFEVKQQKSEYPDKPRNKNRVFTPCSMRMLELCEPGEDDVCFLEAEPINDIIIVGRCINKVEEPMRTIFEINDNTGVFKMLFYQKEHNEVPQALKNFQFQQGAYVKAFGTIRVFKEEKAIIGTYIKSITKFDELTNHLLQIFVAHQIRKKGILSNKEMQSDDHTVARSDGATGDNEHKHLTFSAIRQLGEQSNGHVNLSDIHTLV